MPWEETRPQTLRPEGSREPDSARQLSRPFRPQPVVILPPRASAFGLSPGLHSPDPLGRTGAERLRTELWERVQLFCDEPLRLGWIPPDALDLAVFDLIDHQLGLGPLD